MKSIVVLLVFVCECAWAQCDYSTILSNMVEALTKPRGTLEVSFTNQMSHCLAAMIDATNKANINLVYAISLVDLAEDELSCDILLPQATTICSNLLASSEIPTNAWQRGAASVVLTGIYSFDGKNMIAYENATNGLSMAVGNTLSLEDACLWNAVAQHLDIAGLSVQDALRCYLAISILVNNPTQNVSVYTNGLPESVLGKIKELAE